jgi:hypothetical protein
VSTPLAERIASEPCGCRVDKPTGLAVSLCVEHACGHEADTDERLKGALHESERKAWDSLARYKFQMFGYWAGVWVHLNRIGDTKHPNPFRGLVTIARSAPRAGGRE